MRMNTLLIDADVFCYQFAFRNDTAFQWEEDGEVEHVSHPEVAKMEIDDFVDDLKEKLKGDRVYLILSDRKVNYRKTLAEFYKSNRKSPKPELWEILRAYVESGDHGYQVRQLPRLEGDDVLGIMATTPKRGKRSIIVSIDKDMRTIPGRLYLYNKPELGVIHSTKFEAQRYHLSQVITGDSVDGYKGLPGAGPVAAAELFEQYPDSNYEAWLGIVQMYESRGYTADDALLQARLAYILQHGDYIGGKIKLWKPSRLKV